MSFLCVLICFLAWLQCSLRGVIVVRQRPSQRPTRCSNPCSSSSSSSWWQVGAKVMLLGKSDPRLIVSTVEAGAGAGEKLGAGDARQPQARAAENMAGMSMAQLNAERVARERERQEKRREQDCSPPLAGPAATSTALGTSSNSFDALQPPPRPAGKKKNKHKSGGGSTGGGGADGLGSGGKAKATGPKAGARAEEAGEEEEDVDALLKRLDLDRGINCCGFPKCQTEAATVQMLGTTCSHCRLRSVALPMTLTLLVSSWQLHMITICTFVTASVVKCVCYWAPCTSTCSGAL